MKLRTQIALALLVAAVSVPAAHAEQWGTGPNPRGGTLGTGTVSDTSDMVSRYLRNHPQASRVDTSDVVSRYLRNHPQASRVDTSDVVSRYLRNHAQAIAGPLPSRSDAGFDWADVGIGAGGILVIMLLAGTAAFATRRGRRRLTSA